MWGLLWDRGNLALSGTYGVTREQVDAMFAGGDWILLSHPTRPRQMYLVGPAPDSDVLIACVVEVRETAEGRRFRPIVAGHARRWHREKWNARLTREEEPR